MNSTETQRKRVMSEDFPFVETRSRPSRSDWDEDSSAARADGKEIK